MTSGLLVTIKMTSESLWSLRVAATTVAPQCFFGATLSFGVTPRKELLICAIPWNGNILGAFPSPGKRPAPKAASNKFSPRPRVPTNESRAIPVVVPRSGHAKIHSTQKADGHTTKSSSTAPAQHPPQSQKKKKDFSRTPPRRAPS